MSPPLPGTKDRAQLNVSDNDADCAYAGTGYDREKHERRDSFAFVGQRNRERGDQFLNIPI